MRSSRWSKRGKLLKVCREAAGMRAAELGEVLGYGEDMIRKMERGTRIPRPECLDRADQVLNAQGHLRAFMKDMERARYPKRVRELAQLEERAVEMLLYTTHHIHGLSQTPEYAEAMFENRLPALSQDVVERAVAARVARKVRLRAGSRSRAEFRPRTGDTRTPSRGQDGVASTTRTPPGGRRVAERLASSDAD
jgi:transcriptional regulator with XRE-family HTH domain